MTRKRSQVQVLYGPPPTTRENVIHDPLWLPVWRRYASITHPKAPPTGTRRLARQPELGKNWRHARTSAPAGQLAAMPDSLPTRAVPALHQEEAVAHPHAVSH